jgi:hypothetical protein
MPTFATPEPVNATIEVVGDVRLVASDRTDTVVDVRPGNPQRDADVRLAEATRVEYLDGRLLVKTPRSWRHFTPFGGNETVAVTIELPSGSEVVGESALGHFVAEGELASCRLKTAMGDIRLQRTGPLRAVTGFGALTVDHVDGDAELTTGSGDVDVHDVDGAATIKNSNGDTSVGLIAGDLRVKAANGDVTVGRALASVTAKTACGAVRVAEVVRGRVVLETAAGEVEVGVRPGTAAWLDADTRFGNVHNSLDVADGPPPTGDRVEVRARTSMGDIVIGRPPA